MNKIKWIVLGTLLVSLASNAASHRKTVFINQYDINQDWSLTINEFNNARKTRFDITDENNDGYVDENEYVFEYKNRMDNQLEIDRQAQVKQTVIRFNALDKNENNRIDLSEFEASAQRTFKYFDQNEDGVIDTTDPKKSNKKIKRKKLTVEEKQTKEINRLPYAKSILKMPTTHDFKGMLIKYDLNDNEIISLTEISTVRSKAWSLADENNDGWLSEQEYLYEFEDRLDVQLVETRKRAIEQTYVRFGILDKDKNQNMTFEEYQTSGHRSFNRFDTDKNNVVTLSEELPPKRKKKQNKTVSTNTY